MARPPAVARASSWSTMADQERWCGVDDERAGTGSDRWVVALAAAAGAFGSLDSALNIAFPDLIEDLGLAVVDLRWVVVSFVLSYGGLLVAAGRLGDRFDHRRVLIVGGLASMAALTACAVAPGYGLLLGARVAQGLATALVMAGAPALLSTTGSGATRSAAVFQTAAGVGLAAGPVLGGPLVALGGWRAVFWFRVPVAAAIVALGLVAASRNRPRPPRPVPPSGRPGTAPRGPGPAAAATGGPEAGRSAGGTGHRAVLVAAGALAVAVNGSVFVIWLLVPTLLVDELGTPVFVGGVILACSPLATAIASAGAGRWVGRRPPATVATVGILLMAVGLVALVPAGGVGPLAVAGPGALALVAAALTLSGFGLGLFGVPNMAVVMQVLPPDRQGTAGGLSLMMRTLGIVLGVNGAGLVFGSLVDGGRSFGSAFQLTMVLAAVVATVAAAASRLAPTPPTTAAAATELPGRSGGQPDVEEV